MFWMSMKYEPLIGIFVRAAPNHIKTFIENWRRCQELQAFCIYDSPPVLPKGSIIFLYAVKVAKLVAYGRYAGYGHIKGWYHHALKSDHKPFDKREEKIWLEERERIWRKYGPHRLHTDSKKEFNKFWEDQFGVRGYFLMEDLKEVLRKIPWKECMRILQIRRPIGFGFRYLTKSQVIEFLKLAKVSFKEIEVKGIHSPEVIILE